MVKDLLPFTYFSFGVQSGIKECMFQNFKRLFLSNNKYVLHFVNLRIQYNLLSFQILALSILPIKDIYFNSCTLILWRTGGNND